MAEQSKGTPEVWAAGIGRKSNAQYGSDLMVEVLRELGIKYIALNPGASYRGFHDSMVNFEPGKGPEMIMCTHEEIAVAIANGYARATGEIMATGLHNVVGLQHASMAIFNAWCDRTPIFNLGGGGPQDTTNRRSTDWVHTAKVQGLAVREYVKFDDQPSYGRRRRGIIFKSLSHRHDRAEGAGLYLPRFRCSGSQDRQADGGAACATLPSAGRPWSQSGILAQRVALARRSAVAGDCRRRTGPQSQSSAADAGLGRSVGRAGRGFRRPLRFSEHPSVESYQRARRRAARRRRRAGSRCSQSRRAARSVGARARQLCADHCAELQSDPHHNARSRAPELGDRQYVALAGACADGCRYRGGAAAIARAGSRALERQSRFRAASSRTASEDRSDLSRDAQEESGVDRKNLERKPISQARFFSEINKRVQGKRGRWSHPMAGAGAKRSKSPSRRTAWAAVAAGASATACRLPSARLWVSRKAADFV